MPQSQYGLRLVSLRKVILGFICLAAFWGASALAWGARADDLQGRIIVDGERRTYTVFIPDSVARRRRPAPTVFVLHGGLGSGKRIRKHMGMDAVAEREGFVTVYPDGLGGGWNDGRRAIRDRRYGDYAPDDVRFLSRLARSLAKRGIADPSRTYVTGASNGGMMAFRLACEASDVFTAVAPIIANMPVRLAETCRPGRGVPILVINGTEDRLVPYDGGGVGFRGRRGRVISTAETMKFWRRNNHCAGHPKSRNLPDRDRRDGSYVVMDYSLNCRSDAPVILLTVEGGGHRVPGAKLTRRFLLDRMLGRQNNDISSAEVVWRFFAGWNYADAASP